MDKIKVGIIGTGSISRLHMQGYKDLDNVEVIAACDINEKRVKEYADEFGIKYAYTDYKEMLKLKGLDAVSVCTWNNSHSQISIAALESGKHVLCEKPPAMSAEEAREMQKTSERSGKLLMIGFVRRFGKNTGVILDFIKKGYLGDIYYAKTSCIRRCGNPGGWFSDIKRSGGGPLIDLGVHMIDLSRFLMGKPDAVSVLGTTFNKIGPRNNVKAYSRYRPADPNDYCDVEDMAVAMIKFSNGATLNVEMSFSQNIKDDRLTLELYGSRGGAMVEPKIELYTEMEDYLVDLTPRFTEDIDTFSANFRYETAHFIDCISKDIKCLCPIEDGIEMMKILDAIYESAALGHEIKLK